MTQYECYTSTDTIETHAVFQYLIFQHPTQFYDLYVRGKRREEGRERN